MMAFADIQAHNVLLVLCPHCGGNGEFEIQTFADDLQTVRTKCMKCGHTSDDFYPSKENVNRLVKEWAEGSPAHRLNLPTDAPIVLNMGLGVDSVALAVSMVNQGIKPDLILFSDVGGERPETYAYLTFFDGWLKTQGFPGITVVRYAPVTAPYTTLEGNVLANETLPSISFRLKNCTLKWKAAVMDAYLLGIRSGKNKRDGWAPALASLAQGKKVIKLIGYDAGPIDSCRSTKITEDKNFRYLYPLRHLGWSREDCITAIRKAGLPQPIKSSCFFCASVKKWELAWYAHSHPDLLIRSLVIEDTARNGKHGLGNVKGLSGQQDSWRTWCEQEGIIKEGSYEIIMPRELLLEIARERMPPMESNLDFALPVAGNAAPALKFELPVAGDNYESETFTSHASVVGM
jgi:hypothetical protein